jgi:hypothetical protein
MLPKVGDVAADNRAFISMSTLAEGIKRLRPQQDCRTRSADRGGPIVELGAHLSPCVRGEHRQPSLVGRTATRCMIRSPAATRRRSPGRPHSMPSS